MATTDNIRLAEYRLSQSRCKPGKAVRRAYPWATDAQVQDTAAYIVGGYDVEITSSPAVWVDAYASIRSCMQGKGALCARAYTPHNVQIAVLRNADGVIVARALVRNGCANKAYGASAHTLLAVLEVLGGVTLTRYWLDGIADQIQTTELVPAPSHVWTSAPVYNYQVYDIVNGKAILTGEGKNVRWRDIPAQGDYRRVYTEFQFVKDFFEPTLVRTRVKQVFRPYCDTH